MMEFYQLPALLLALRGNRNSFSILISGLAGMLAGTISMAMGEYVSVNTQKIHKNGDY